MRYRLDDDDHEEEEEEEGDEMTTTAKQEQGFEKQLEEMLLKQRRIFLCAAVDENSARDAIRRLWFLESVDPGKPILLVINSPGGSVDSGFAIWDQIKMVSSPVVTLVTGLAASMGSLLSLVGGKGGRFATKNARIMIHQPSIHGTVRGQATDLEIQAREILKTRDILIDIYQQETGQDRKTIAKAIDRDMWMGAQEALEFGLLDGIVESYQELDHLLKI